MKNLAGAHPTLRITQPALISLTLCLRIKKVTVPAGIFIASCLIRRSDNVTPGRGFGWYKNEMPSGTEGIVIRIGSILDAVCYNCDKVKGRYPLIFRYKYLVVDFFNVLFKFLNSWFGFKKTPSRKNISQLKVNQSDKIFR